MADVAAVLISATFLAPAVATALLGAWMMLSSRRLPERAVVTLVGSALWASVAVSTGVLGLFLVGLRGEVEVGEWVRLGSYVVPIVYSVDRVAVVFSLLAALSTALVVRFSATYLHLEPGFARFFLLLGIFGTGVQLVAFAGALDLMFAGWELLGISSALFIGYFWERSEPAHASLRAFATYRLCDIGFFLGIVSVHELLGTTRMAVLGRAADLGVAEQTLVGALFLLPALGKSAQLPFSSWLPRALEGPTPSSALFYGALSIHAGLYLLLRIHPLLDAAPIVEYAAIAIGLATSAYGALVARVQTDAKGTLAFSTLTQTGLILAEIAAGLTTLALVHLVGHALLRLAQYLRAPNVLHDTHARGHHHPVSLSWERALPPSVRLRLYASALHRFRLDDRVDRALAPLLALADGLARADRAYRRLLSFDRDR